MTREAQGGDTIIASLDASSFAVTQQVGMCRYYRTIITPAMLAR
jgi:hypothetical protein